MKIYANQLQQHLKQGLAPVYVLTGDEPLQMAECGDAIRAAARAQGYTGREVMYVEAGFDWQRLLEESRALSLFAERRILELRMPNAKPGTQGASALAEYCAQVAPDIVLLVTMGKPESEATRSKWFKALDAAGVVVQIYPVERSRLPQWIDARMRQAGLQPGAGVADMLSDRVEGNLLAAAQEIEKLRLLHGTGRIDAEQLLDAVADSARYDVFGLVDAALNGEAARVVRMLEGLRAEGEEPLGVLWVFAREIRTMAMLAHDIQGGAREDAAFTRHRVWDKRKPAVRLGLRRHNEGRWQALLRRAGRIDRIVKGQGTGDPWDELQQLALLMAGVRLPVVMARGA